MTDTPSFIPGLPTLRPDLLKQALTHRSLCVGQVSHEETNERLEFLGDAVLELVVSEHLYAKYPSVDEGTLTRYRSALVRTESLAFLARELDLAEHLRMNNAGEATLSDSILANTFEAIMGALYLSSGLQACFSFLREYMFPHSDEFIGQDDGKDAKTLLQEKVQAQGKPSPSYTTVKAEGPDHAKNFTIAVMVEGLPRVTGTGPSKQKAEQDAAQSMLANHFPDKA